MRGRRKFLLSAGSLATISTIGTVSASKRDTELSTEKVNREFLSGITENGARGAKQALEDLGLDPTVEESKLANRDVSEDDQQVSPQYVYGDPEDTDSSLVVSSSPAIGSDPEVWMSVSMFLEDPKYTLRNSWWCPDAIGVGYNANDWAAVGEPSVRATHDHTAKYTAEDVADDALAGTVELKDHSDKQYGSGASDRLPDATVGLTGKFKLREDKVPTTLWGSYTHTFSPDPTGSIKNISGGKNGLGVEVSLSAAKAWSKALPTDPKDDLPD